MGGTPGDVAARLSHGVRCIVSTREAFAAVTTQGSVVTWGHPDGGGDSRSVARYLAGGVQLVTANLGAFAAVAASGDVVTWGNRCFGGNDWRLNANEDSLPLEVRADDLPLPEIVKVNGIIQSWSSRAPSAPYWVGLNSVDVSQTASAPSSVAASL